MNTFFGKVFIDLLFKYKKDAKKSNNCPLLLTSLFCYPQYTRVALNKGFGMPLSAMYDPLVLSMVHKEQTRLEEEITLIASENYASPAVMSINGSTLTNKYAEGYPGKRYYAGCSVVDEIEAHAIELCKKLFGVDHVNVQPHAGSQANLAVYHTILNPGDTILGMSLADGGHLTHGHKVNFSGKIYNSIQYSVDRTTETLDYDAIAYLAQLHKPKLIIAGASAYSRTIDFSQFRKIADLVGAFLVADIAHIAGLVATGHHPSPVGHAHFITSTTHKTLRGPRGGLIMCSSEHAEMLDKAIMPGTQGGPFMHTIAAKAQAFHEALQPSFALYQDHTMRNARACAQAFANLGYRIVSQGTDNHLFIIDLRTKNITGIKAQQALEKVGIIVSRSTIPFDPEKPWITSGIRIGTPAATTRGMKEAQMVELAHLVDEVITHHTDEMRLAAIKKYVVQMAALFPVYGGYKPAAFQPATQAKQYHQSPTIV